MIERVKAIFKKNLIGWPLVAVVFSVVMIVFVIFPQIISFIATNFQINQTRLEIEALNKKADSLSQLDSKTYQANLDIALEVLPPEKDLPSSMSQVQLLLAQNGLPLDGVNFINGSTASSSSQSFSMRIETSGPISSLDNFINQLKGAPQIMKLVGLEVSTSRGQTQDSLTIESYFKVLPQSLGSVEQPLNNLSQQDLTLLSDLQSRVQSLPVVSSSNLVVPRGKSNPFQ